LALLGLIGGTGLDRWAGNTSPQEPNATPYGDPSGPLLRISGKTNDFLFLPRHGPTHDIAPHRVNYRANIDALTKAGVTAILTVNAVGGIDPSLPPGSLVLPDQLIDYTWGRAHTFLDGDRESLDHVEFAEPFSHDWRVRLLQAGAASGIALRDGGCIAVTQGPRLETAAEIRRLAHDGCDLVGMTSMPEAALARERRLPYATLAVVANLAAGLDDEPITMEEIDRTLDAAMRSVRRILEKLLESP
jgi:5'-methylthioinosine phosphorylase